MDGSSNVSSRSQSLILKPGEVGTTKSEQWSLKANQLFSNQLTTISQQETETETETGRSEIEFISPREAIVYLGEMKFSLKLVDVEHSEAYLGGNGEFSCQGGVHGRFMLTSAGQEPSIGRYPVQPPTKKRSIDLATLPPSAPFDVTHSRANTRRAASPPSSRPPATSSSTAAASAHNNKVQEEVGVAGVRLDDLPLQTSAHDITSFFSGLKIRSTFFSYYLSPTTSEWKCLVYVCFESTTGASLAIQRSGERLRNKALPVSVAPVDAWELYCAQCRGLESSLASADWIKLPEAMLLAASPREVAEFWFRHLSPAFSSRSHIFNDLRGAYARSLLDEELRMAWDKQDMDDQTDHSTAVIERLSAISRDALLETLRKRVQCLWIAVAATEGAGSFMATFQRAASLDEHFFSVLWRLQLQSRVSSMLTIHRPLFVHTRFMTNRDEEKDVLEPTEEGRLSPDYLSLRKAVEAMTVELASIRLRNELKEIDKAFEVSYTRMLIIMGLTYATLFLYMLLIGVPNPALNAVVPSIGFNLSTWSLPVVKTFWRHYCFRKSDISANEEEDKAISPNPV